LVFGHGTDNAWDEALWLALFALGLAWTKDEGILQNTLNQTQNNSVTQLFNRRIVERKAAAYLTGRSYFAGLEFIVDETVLVPRSPIAVLISNSFEPWLTSSPLKILDLCTGSGCIGIACAYAFPEAQVDCSDISAPALHIAQQNIALHKLENRVTAIASDMFANVDGPYDLIVSNPPYVDAEEMANLPQEFCAEPALGLAAGNDGLDICRRILREATLHLTADGYLIVEVGNSWHALEAAFSRVPFTWVEFTYGGEGVFVMSAAELRQYAPYFEGDDIIR